MSKRVLDVGNCDYDHGAIRRLLQQHFGADVFRAHDAQQAEELLRHECVDLVLVNRLLDRDHSEGLAIIHMIKQSPEWAQTPVMLLTNYEQHQQTAIAAGAEPGFGKADLQAPATLEKLRPFLA
jgi:CheY-like chemotaxis protein